LSAFYNHIARLEEAGYIVRRIAVLENIATIADYNFQLMAADAARVHADWFRQFESRYRPLTTKMIRNGQHVNEETRVAAQALQKSTQADLHALMRSAQIDLWISSAATGPAPHGISSTGNSAMNLPWTFAGLPAIMLPAGKNNDGLPLGIHCTAMFMADEPLLAWSAHLAAVLTSTNFPIQN
jgi:Asp-tRNA(Asn)/Glu-tRNA(Gln) amidotransferase A subunit family amidase